MMFSKFKPAQPGDNRPRCSSLVVRNGILQPCGRLAKLYDCHDAKTGHFFGQVSACGNHLELASGKSALNLTLVDRRKKGAVIA